MEECLNNIDKHKKIAQKGTCPNATWFTAVLTLTGLLSNPRLCDKRQANLKLRQTNVDGTDC